ncbi:MAG: FAD-binding protein, partial [Nitriliruptor sp.]
MAEVELPQLGESVEEGVITAWLVEVGDTVEVDQPIVEISTDKVDTEIPSPVAGTVTELKAEVDDTIAVGSVIAIIGEDDGAATDDQDDDGDTDDQDAPSDDDTADAPAEQADEPEQPPAGDQRPAATSDAPSGQRVAKGEDHDADVIVLGGGTGGYSVALRAAQLGLDVVLIERAKVGGTCLHWGCIPAKAILQTAEVAEHAQEAADFGVKVDYHGIEVAALNAHKAGVVEKMWKGLQGALKGRGVETIIGDGHLIDTHTIEVRTEDGSRTVSAAAVVIATGSKPRELPFAPFDGERIISSDHALYLEELPDSAVILGSGAVGMEFATAWSTFGVDVTIVELEDRLLPLEDADSSKEIGRSFRKRGITAMTGVKMSGVEVTDTGVVCTIDTGDAQEQVEADLLLVAVGR